MITARYQSKDLRDHLAGFLAANGVRDIPFEETSPICIFLNELPDPLGRKQLTYAAKEMKKQFGLKHCFCLEIIIRSFGYDHTTDGFNQMRGGHLVRKDR
jgi:hypothetical protein